MKKAFTLLELIIAMGIMAVLLGFSTYALVQIRGAIELQNADSDVVSAFQTIQNRARNSVTTPGSSNSSPDYVSIAFTSKSYKFQTCTKTGSRVTCVDDAPTVKALDTLNVLVQPSTQPNGCSTIAYARLSADIISIDSSGNIGNAGTCTITLTHSGTGNFRVISIDLESNSINANFTQN